MSALAVHLLSRGYRVRGSDRAESKRIRYLRGLGIPVSIGEEEKISEQIVVYTGAVDRGQPQLKDAEKAGKRLISRAKLLGSVAEEFPHVVSVAGCHGKTSTTAMLAHIFEAAGKKFTCHIGGDDLTFGNYYHCGDDIFLTEACEYQRSFLSLKSSVAVILNIDKDHTDCYHNDQELIGAFCNFAENAEKTVVPASDVRLAGFPRTTDFGGLGEYRMTELRVQNERYAFTVVEKGIPLVRVQLNVCGRVHAENALAAFACARFLGISAEDIKRGLESFRGVKRRFEEVGKIAGVPVICDYAHHPREISAVFETAKAVTEGTVRLVFQPHTYTRTRDLMRDFTDVLKCAENPIIYATYPARESYCYEGSAVALVSRVPEASYVSTPQEIRKRLIADGIKSGDLVLVLGAGDIYEKILSVLD